MLVKPQQPGDVYFYEGLEAAWYCRRSSVGALGAGWEEERVEAMEVGRRGAVDKDRRRGQEGFPLPPGAAEWELSPEDTSV